jgi:hypothetical protein
MGRRSASHAEQDGTARWRMASVNDMLLAGGMRWHGFVGQIGQVG